LKQKFLKDFDLKITKQQLSLLPSVSKNATQFYQLNRVLVQQNQNQK